jgi:hypothetical protein
LRLIDPSQPRPAGLALIFDIPLGYFVFSLVHHGGNLQPYGPALQVRQIRRGWYNRPTVMIRENSGETAEKRTALSHFINESAQEMNKAS